MGLFSSVGKIWKDFTGQTAVEQQNEFNMQMWKMQQEYNTPANQMKRYREAGLNPNLVYGGSGQMAGNATSAPEMTAHQGSAQKAMDLLSWAVSLSGQLNEQKMNTMKTVADIQHSQDALELQKKTLDMNNLFRNLEFTFRKDSWEKDYDLRKTVQALNKDRWLFEKENYDKFGTKPGTMWDFLGKAIFGVTGGKNVTDVAGETGRLMSDAIGLSYTPNIMGYKVGNYLNSFIGDILKDIKESKGKPKPTWKKTGWTRMKEAFTGR